MLKLLHTNTPSTEKVTFHNTLLGVIVLVITALLILPSCSPSNMTKDMNPDTHFTFKLSAPVVIGTQGKIRVFEASTHTLVDSLDMSIPAGPTTWQDASQAIYTPEPYVFTPAVATNRNTKPGTPSGLALPNPDTYQLTIIGGFTDAFHFYPIIAHDSIATIYLHHNMLDYGKEYYMTIDEGVLNGLSFSAENPWRFSTKKEGPKAGTERVVVSADGNGDFSTVQGALDFTAEDNPKPVTIFIKNGDYQEIVYFRNKKNVIIEGESREGVVIHYYNNSVFNPHPFNIKINEKKGTFPYRRAAFAADNVQNLTLKNLTVINEAKGQAEGLFLMGNGIHCENISIVGDGDALQANGQASFDNCSIDGGGDLILSRGALYFKDCRFSSNGGPFMWMRNGQDSHGAIFVNCSFEGLGDRPADLARCPLNNGPGYPYSEAIFINCQMKNISSLAFSRLDGDTSQMRYWEYCSTDFDGNELNYSGRNPASKRIDSVTANSLLKDFLKESKFE